MLPAEAGAGITCDHVCVLYHGTDVSCTCVLRMQILVVIPCAGAYYVELLWKSDFLRVQSPPASSVSATRETPSQVSLTWITFDVVCFTLLLCESIIQLAPALQCECQAH